MAPKGEIGSLRIMLEASTAKLQEDFKEANKHLRSFQKEIGAIGDIVKATFAFQVGKIAFDSVNKLTQALQDLASAGEKAGSIQEVFQGLGGTNSAIEKARNRIVGLVDSFDLMAIANKGLIAGTPKFKEAFEDIVDLGGRLANAYGTDTKQKIEELTEAIVKGQAKGLTSLGFVFTNTSSKSKVTREAITQLKDVLKGLPAVTDSVANATDSYHKTLEGVTKQHGIQLNNNKELTEAYRTLEKSVNELKFGQFIEGLAKIEAWFVRLTASAITLTNTIIERFSNGASVLKEYFNLSSGSGLLAIGKKGGISGRLQQARDNVSEQDLQQQKQSAEQAQKVAEEQAKGAEQLAKSERNAFLLNEQLKNAAKNAEEAKKSLTKLAESDLREIERNLTSAIKAGNKAGVEDYLAKFKEALTKQATEQVRLMKGLNQDQAENLKNNLIDEAYIPAVEAWSTKQKEAMQESVDFWQSVFENAITGVSFNLKDALKQVAVGFAAQLASNIFQVKGISSIQGLGGQLASGLGGDILGGLGQAAGLTSGAGAISGLGSLLGVAGAEVGPGTAGAGLLGSLGIGAETAASIQGVTAALGPYALAAGAAYLALKHFGVFGGRAKDPDTVARRQVETFLEDKLGRNVVIGPTSRFNTAEGWESLTKLDEKTKAAFTGVGEQIVALLGITRDVGKQIGAILADDLGGNAMNINTLLKKLGLTMYDLQAKMIQLGKDGKKTWLEIESSIAGVEGAVMKARSSIKYAMEEIATSGGTGQAALDGVRDAAIAASKNGALSLKDLKAMMLKQGDDPELVKLLFKAFAQRGITSLEQIMNASDRTLGAVIADITAMGYQFRDATEAINMTAEAIDRMNKKKKESEVGGGNNTNTTTVNTNAFGGIVATPTFFHAGKGIGLMGEAGAEAIMPLTRINGKLGVRATPSSSSQNFGGIVINVDARGADAGVEYKVTTALRSLEERVVMRAVNEMNDQFRRGRWTN